jgi:hypothetical protein
MAARNWVAGNLGASMGTGASGPTPIPRGA